MTVYDKDAFLASVRHAMKAEVAITPAAIRQNLINYISTPYDQTHYPRCAGHLLICRMMKPHSHTCTDSSATCSISPGGLSITILAVLFSIRSHGARRGGGYAMKANKSLQVYEYPVRNNSEEPLETLTRAREEQQQSNRCEMNAEVSLL